MCWVGAGELAGPVSPCSTQNSQASNSTAPGRLIYVCEGSWKDVWTQELWWANWKCKLPGNLFFNFLKRNRFYFLGLKAMCHVHFKWAFHVPCNVNKSALIILINLPRASEHIWHLMFITASNTLAAIIMIKCILWKQQIYIYFSVIWSYMFSTMWCVPQLYLLLTDVI